jgi:ribosomal protein S18 acetylase RimI-like enzyme
VTHEEPHLASPVVRRYTAADREAVHRIAAETAFFGEPIELYLDDRRHFLDLFVASYTDHLGEFIWVAEENGRVVGYVSGCPDTDRHERLLLRRVLPGVLVRLLRGHYRIGAKSRRYIGRLFLASLRGESLRADHALYPAHLHINVAEERRGRGLGRRLITACLEQLRAAGRPGVHLHTTTLNQPALRLYRSLGFELLEARPTRQWEGIIAGPVQSLLFGLRLMAWTDPKTG